MTYAVMVTTGALPTLAAGQTAPAFVASITAVKVEYWHKDQRWLPNKDAIRRRAVRLLLLVFSLWREDQVLLCASPPPICSTAIAADKMSMP